MAIIVEEPIPIPRSTAGELVGTLTSLGFYAPTEAGVLSRSYISAIYGNSVAKVGSNMTLPNPNIMSVLDYAGHIAPAISWLCYDSSAVNGARPGPAFEYRIGFDVVTTPQTGAPSTFSYGLKDFTGFLNPVTSVGFGVDNPNGPFGWIGQNFEVFGDKTYNITKAGLVAGQLPSFNMKIKVYWGWVGVPPPSAVVQLQLTPAYQDNTVTLPAPYYGVVFYPRSKPATTRGFEWNNLSALSTPYNILPNPYGGTGLTTGNVPTEKSTLQSIYRQSPTVALGGPSYVYVPGDTFPAGAKIFECDLNLKVFPPLYYVYGIDIASSTITWGFPSYSTNPLDSRP